MNKRAININQVGKADIPIIIRTVFVGLDAIKTYFEIFIIVDPPLSIFLIFLLSQDEQPDNAGLRCPLRLHLGSPWTVPPFLAFYFGILYLLTTLEGKNNILERFDAMER